MVAFKYVGPFDEVEGPDIGTVKRLGVVEVDADVAGSRPKGKPLDDDGNPNPDHDPGSGLYAQPDAWEHVASKKGDA